MNAIEQFKKEWGVSGMSADKIRLANAAISAGLLAAEEITDYVDPLGRDSYAIKEQICREIKAKAGEL